MGPEDGPAGQAPQRVVAVVPHTHWDREWYSPFETMRLRLVDVVDDLLDRLETDPSYAHFLLDGQMAAVDDYLAVRPEAEDRLRALATSGRITVGPWYVLPDEFCVSGETLVRNLELGLQRAEAFGGAMEVGYLPDMFGHAAQMPQLLSQAGFDHAVVWRGVPAAVDRTGFWWTAPDGSTVRAEYLPVGYGNGAAMPVDAARLVRRVHAHVVELGGLLAPGAPLLWMNGGDHLPAQPGLGRVVAQANEAQDGLRLTVTTLPAYLASAPTDDLPAWTGELRSGARANLLMGVLSNRVDVKQAAARAERSLERRAEPLSALFLAPHPWPAEAQRLAWLEVVRHAAHDSSCACSADEVVDAVLGRYSHARQVGDGLADRAVAALGETLAVAGTVAVNPGARRRRGLIEIVVADDAPEGAQVVAAHAGSVVERVVPGAEVATVLGQARRTLAEGAAVLSVDADDDADDGLHIVIRTGVPPPAAGAGSPDVAADLAELYARVGAETSRPVHLRVENGAVTRALVHVDDVPPFGWRAWTPGPAAVAAAMADVNVLDNGVVRLEVDGNDGTFALRTASGAGAGGLDRLVDDGDAGDTYNWSPPADDVVVDRPATVDIEVLETGPLRAALRVRRGYVWPEHIRDDRRQGTRAVEVVTLLELRAGEPLVRITTTLDNTCRDHRLRTLFPLPGPASTSTAECAFAVVERGTRAEGGPHEVGLPTFPSRRFVSAGDLTLVHEGLLEYELVDGQALALTLLRCVGLLSGTHLRTRPHPAGPPVAVEGAQMPGPRTLRYGVAVGVDDPYALADMAFLPLEVGVARGTGTRPASGSALDVTGAEVSAVRRVGDDLEVRVFNPTDRATTVAVAGRRGRLVDLRGRPGDAFEESFTLRPWGIATARLSS